jgi:hypothetical protein
MNLFTKQIDDKYVRQNFEKIEESFNALVFTLGDFEFFEFKIPSAQNKFKLYHNLGFNPNDVLVTKAIGSSFEFDYNGFNDKYLTIKTTGEVYIRCFIGNMKGSEVSGANAAATIDDNTGGAGGGTFSFLSRETIVDAYIFSERKIVIASVPIEGSVTVFYNGLPLPGSAWSMNQNIVTLEPSLDIHIGDGIFITFTS